jgi:addiction module HigA family antidote
MPKLDASFSIAVHPGDILREMLDDVGISQAQLARHLKTDTARINEICRRRRGISARMAVMLGQALGTSAGLWMNLQKNWELSQVDPRTAGRIRPLRVSA